MDSQFDAFLSYVYSDKPKVVRLAEKLRKMGLRIWLDEWVIQPGDDIYLAIEKGLQHSRCLILCMSNAAFGSDWVSLERSTSLFRDPQNLQRRFIPILLEKCQIPEPIRRYAYIDATTLDNQTVARIVDAIDTSVGSNNRTMNSFYGAGYPFDESLVFSNLRQFGMILPAMQLYFYVSETKVSHLHTQIPDDALSPTKLRSILTRKLSQLYQGFTLDLDKLEDVRRKKSRQLALLETLRELLSISFGKDRMVNVDRQSVGLMGTGSLLSMLREVLCFILLHKSVLSIRCAIQDQNEIDAFCYACTELFEYSHTTDAGILVFISRIESKELHLHCSGKYFSDITLKRKKDGSIVPVPSSFFHGLFELKQKTRFTSVFFITSKEDKVVYGSPLFMALA